MKRIQDAFDDGWKTVCKYVSASLVFLDDAAAESLHWHGGLDLLLGSGSVGVRNFSIFEKVNPMYKKATFVVTSAITEAVLQVLMILIQSNSFRSCCVVTALPPSSDHEGQLVSNLEKQLLCWMGNTNYSVEVVHVPIFGVCLLENVFVVPSLSKSFLPVMPEFLQDDIKKENGLKSLSDNLQKSVKMLSSYLNAFLDSLQVKGDVFSLGPLSHIVGTEVENLCHHSKKKAYPTKASVILLDRSLDLAGPLSQSAETLFSKMLRVLPHLPGHNCDVQICMSDLTKCQSETVFDLPLLAPGCVAHRYNSTETDNLTTLLTKRSKEAVMEINRNLVQVGIKDGIVFDSTTASAQKQLRKRVLCYKDKPHLISKNCGLLQQALGVAQILEHPLNDHLNDLLATEKLLLQNFAVSGTGIFDDIGRLIANHKDRGYKMSEVLTLIAFLYALSKDRVLGVESEAALQATVMEALFQDDLDTVGLVRKIAGDDADDQDILVAVKVLFQVFQSFSNFRKDLKKYKSIFDSSDPALPACYIPLLKQVLESIYKGTDTSDMEFHSVGLRDYIKTGFSLFMNVARPQPKDNPLIIVFVIGGITTSEIRLVHDLANLHKTPKILVGSTGLMTPESIADDIFGVVKDLSCQDEESEDFY